jgi:preprotein translocase subunit SecA
MSDRFKNIVFPLTDGRREMELLVNLKEAYESDGKAISKSFEKNIILAKIDDEWKEHLREMDDLRSAVNNATYEQKDPLVVYKLESYELFRSMMNRLNEGAVELLMNLNMPSFIFQCVGVREKRLWVCNGCKQLRAGLGSSKLWVF